jgi:hypothetical protein
VEVWVKAQHRSERRETLTHPWLVELGYMCKGNTKVLVMNKSQRRFENNLTFSLPGHTQNHRQTAETFLAQSF